MSLLEQIDKLDADMQDGIKSDDFDEPTRLIITMLLNLYQSKLMAILYCHVVDPQGAGVPVGATGTLDPEEDRTVVLNVGNN